MRKLINEPGNIVNELVEGFLLINSRKIKKIGNFNVIARKKAPVKNQVGIVIGGGAGHEPLFLEYVGKNMADVEVHGNIFAAPPPKAVLGGIKAADGGAGVILLYNNYSGDVFNFNVAQDLARKEGILIDTVLINDEISSASVENMDDRRGTTADHIVINIAGAAAQSGMKFGSIIELLKQAVYNSRSLGVSLSACTLPETGFATFTLEEGKMEFGMGLHGEAGIKRVDLASADETAKTIIDYLVADLPYKNGDEVIAIINGYGSTTRMEMFIVARAVYYYLKEKGISPYNIEAGEFCTSQEMAGISITLIKLDESIKHFYDMEADSPGYSKFKA